MTGPVAGGKIQETQIGRYRSTRGLDYESVPWRLWEKSKKLFWDPADIDFSQDALDWRAMSQRQRTRVALAARGFMVGEDARAAAGLDDEYQRGLVKRRLEALAVARTMNTAEADAGGVEAFEPEELQHVD